MTTREYNIAVIKEKIVKFRSENNMHMPATYANIIYDKISSRLPECESINYNNINFKKRTDLIEIYISCNCKKFISKPNSKGSYKTINCTTYTYYTINAEIAFSDIRLETNFDNKYIVYCTYNHKDKRIYVIKDGMKVINSNVSTYSGILFQDTGSEEYYKTIAKKYESLNKLL